MTILYAEFYSLKRQLFPYRILVIASARLTNGLF